MDENTFDNTNNESSSDQVSIKEVNQGFHEVNERFDNVETLILDNNTYQNEVLDNVLTILSENNESSELSEGEDIQEEELPYEAILTSIDDRLDLQNHLIVGQNFMFGIITGVLLFKILWERLKP